MPDMQKHNILQGLFKALDGVISAQGAARCAKQKRKLEATRKAVQSAIWYAQENLDGEWYDTSPPAAPAPTPDALHSAYQNELRKASWT